ncbi:nuclear transport factor 2 family protein [Confluentibacter flavum]|uniref:Nuclear transport factor 2 family protein n=1 Tax=Confluentibacter flavum TaxID=1909700 RepID=A0A2N3HHE5_9FLAO|nr:nuclear transport factor 2 family protein [Confluentibacter flavum]PKQ44334.1 nuclear transport factor 2 family protein [Confluentibacter flavum]
MKKLLMVGLAVVLLTSCNKQEKRYTQNSPEIDTYKKVMDDYKTLNWEDYPTHYADTAKIANNVVEEKALTVSQAIEKSKEDAAMFSWVVEKEEYEMVMTDEEETWVNFWGIWKGTMKSTNKEYVIPFHSTARFVDGKIVEEFGYWDNSEIVSDLLQMEQESASATSNSISE